MENNIFFKNKKDKFNPDVISNLTKKSTERKKIEFKESKSIYNSITNNVPDKIKNARDLQLKLDEPNDNIKRLLTTKMNERSKQEVDLKPQKLKTLPKDLIIDKHIENFEELKKNSEVHIKKEEDIKNLLKTKKIDIMSKLNKSKIITNIKDLNIFKK
jgi:hypothetical protein